MSYKLSMGYFRKWGKSMEKNQQVLVNDGFFHDIYLCLCAKHELKAGQMLGTSVRSHYMLYYTLSGRGSVCHGKTAYPLTVNKGLFVLPNTPVNGQAAEGEGWNCLQIGFSGQKVERFFAAMKGDFLEKPFMCTQNQKLEALANQILALPKGTLEQVLYREFLLYSFFSVLMQEDVFGQNFGGRKEKNPYVAEALCYISDHFAEPMLVGKAASHLGISRNYFFLLFKQSMGCSPLDYIIRFRLERAAELLKQTEYSVDVIAASCGYQEPAVFSRAFKKKYGKSPSQYRKEVL